MSDQADTPEGTPEPVPCQPCRGTGKVVSRKGGEEHEVTCPWCEGGGVFIPEHDAQAHWRSDAPHGTG